MIIKHGLVVDPASGLSEHMDILVKNGKIARIAPEISEDSEEILEAGGLVVGPGLIDTHVHFRDPGFTRLVIPSAREVSRPIMPLGASVIGLDFSSVLCGA